MVNPSSCQREIVIAGERFLFDRIVSLGGQELVRIAQEQEIIASARTEQGPFDAVYVSAPPRADDELARYLPERLGQPDITCPAETADITPVDAEGVRYAFAGNETDLTAEVLQVVGDSEGNPIYADLASTPPYPELFVASGGGLLRFLPMDPDGRPAPITESLAFNGRRFGFDSDATDSVDPAGLTKVGCSTAFPVYASAGSSADTSTQLYVLAGGRYLLFTGEGAPAATTTTAPSTTTTTLPPTTTTLPPTTTTSAAADHDHDHDDAAAHDDHDDAAAHDDHDDAAAHDDHDDLPPTTTTTTLPPTTTTTLAADHDHDDDRPDHDHDDPAAARRPRPRRRCRPPRARRRRRRARHRRRRRPCHRWRPPRRRRCRQPRPRPAFHRRRRPRQHPSSSRPLSC